MSANRDGESVVEVLLADTLFDCDQCGDEAYILHVNTAGHEVSSTFNGDLLTPVAGSDVPMVWNWSLCTN